MHGTSLRKHTTLTERLRSLHYQLRKKRSDGAEGYLALRMQNLLGSGGDEAGQRGRELLGRIPQPVCQGRPSRYNKNVGPVTDRIRSVE